MQTVVAWGLLCLVQEARTEPRETRPADQPTRGPEKAAPTGQTTNGRITPDGPAPLGVALRHASAEVRLQYRMSRCCRDATRRRKPARRSGAKIVASPSPNVSCPVVRSRHESAGGMAAANRQRVDSVPVRQSVPAKHSQLVRRHQYRGAVRSSSSSSGSFRFSWTVRGSRSERKRRRTRSGLRWVLTRGV